MKKLSKLCAILGVSLAIINCSTFRTSDFEIMVQLPASGNCFGLRVMSGQETRYPKEQCIEIMKRAIFMTSPNWRMLRGDIQTNCQYAQCKQISGAFDGLFLTIDQALQLPGVIK